MAENPMYERPTDGPFEGAGVHLGRPSPNQLVSYNLLRARRSRGWKQQEVGELMGRYTGRPWSNASVSAAERAWKGGRPRKFDANEILAFCRIFDVPFSYFLLPPEEERVQGVSTLEEGIGGGGDVSPFFPMPEYLKSVLGVEPPADHTDRAQKLVKEATDLDWFPPKWDYVGAGLPAAEVNELGPDDDFEAWRARLNLPAAAVQSLVKTYTEQISAGTAEALDELGYIRNPDLDEQLGEIRKELATLQRLVRETGGA
ncbi:helix-turn-helix transcriptional regulator [Streptomyces sp. NPDC051994]|uniref:helix-turn-helix domain-containing protein n=1 Tax=unclassified Streptomyces TaxID=2593676 RepID=UPI003421B80B